jgi:hypothetical protein
MGSVWFVIEKMAQELEFGPIAEKEGSEILLTVSMEADHTIQMSGICATKGQTAHRRGEILPDPFYLRYVDSKAPSQSP